MDKKYSARLIVAAITFFTAIWISTPTIPAAFKKVALGEAPPAFSLKGLDGSQVSSGDIIPGKVSVVVFWATWSPRSLEKLRDLDALRAELGDRTFQLVAVNAEHQTISRADEETIKAELGKIDFAGLVLIDDGLVAYSDYGAMALPSSLVIGEDGKVTFSMAGYPTTMRSDLVNAIKKALGLVTEEDLAVKEEYVPRNHALMYYNMGKRLMEKGQEEKGQGQLLESVSRDPDFTKPHVLLGIYYKKTGDHEKALTEFETVLKLDPSNHEAGYQLAAVSLRAGKLEEAEKLFRDLLTEYPEREELALGLALALQYEGKDVDAAAAREQAKTLYPAGARYYYEFGGVAEGQQDLASAAVLYRRALEDALAHRR